MPETSETVVIVGGAVIGSFAAFFLREQGFTGQIKVVERDSTYQFCSTALSAASIRSQFHQPYNIAMSLFGANLFRNIKQWFGQDADIGFVEQGYLILGDKGHEQRHRNAARVQIELGAEIDILDPEQVNRRFPWMNVEDIGIGTYGTRNEGWFDAWALMQLVRRAARQRGVEYIHDEVVGLDVQGGRITGLRLANSGERLSCDWCVNAAGAWGGMLARMAGLQLPVEPRKRTAFHIKAPLEKAGFPMLFDSTGAWIRPEGEGFICGIAPEEHLDQCEDGDFEPDHYLLEDRVWPLLAHRIPALEQLRVQRAWAGYYEMNLFDHNAFIGAHPEISNFVLATGFSGHGVMHSPATGRAVAEHIAHGEYRSIDVSALSFDRVVRNQPIREGVVY
ncbi:MULTISPECIES: NAD(P)/FAD-dependent oxidoreductase [Pseudomonas]|uniref:NAD(P)/FAD-dependent oxidoreductase n=1 Tax=Pseudomonas TaxID=286 RepID=UPI00224A87A3|nr:MULTISPECIES: FAD-binding oxidoreductase [unclassified Pseudomonas]MCX2891169.1 FAD-binding oxidoreductase [Pseudomonas sp. DCB_BI]MDH0704931.1 FAD-binding oxidoreductase [Pseudomonas sp. GD03862]